MKKIFIIFSFVIMPIYADTITCETKQILARFEPIEYTCDSGYFLPANTTGCRICPTGHTCDGGTFAFNPTISQGINYPTPTTQNTTNTCAYNFAHNLVAVFEPKTITVNWDDGSGTTTTNTCVYDGTITLPPEPTRPGYTFNGWVLKPD